MSNETKAQKKEQNQNQSTVVFDGKKYRVSRLRAGRFHDALKVYMQMIQTISPKNIKHGQKEEDMEFDYDSLVKGMLETWPDKKAEIVAICCTTAVEEGSPDEPVDLSKQFILDNAYPEEINTAFENLIKLNRLAEALKNSAAPMEGLKALNVSETPSS